MQPASAAEVQEAFTARDERGSQRPAAYIGGTSLVLAMLFGLAAVPAVPRALGVSFVQLIGALGAIAAGSAVGTVAHRRWGMRSRAFFAAHVVEFGTIACVPLVLVYLSGRAISVFWAWYAAIVVMNSGFLTWRRVHAPLTIAGPLVLAAAFFLNGATGEGATALVFGATTFAAYHVMNLAARRVAHGQVERALLEKELAARDREDQRRRIARDLHDGLGADLTALLWQARELAAGAPGGAGKGQLEALARVASDALGELRAVVDGIRGPLERWEQLVADVRLRASLLCGAAVECEVRLGESVPPEGRIPPRVAVEVPRFVLEAVRNAVAHSACSRVGVRVERAGEALVVEIEDDGRGLGEGERAASRGGLAHLDERARALGGALAIEALAPGTRIALRVPCSWDGGG